ncbi:hypothetical protein [Paenibacillus sp. RUD330]|uniref:hypothetical protein n=1 Tax=Paenibacillus sp. RUD330 TaxID=2023772 RepID=UPI0012FE5D82|nr:hypothetical protein [Paenibacillus sp. RUD330]ASS66220.2 hypothetical protein CIC07_08710 [Paenibacillus sp. RUD330]
MRTKGYLDKWPEYERFKAGDQWPPATDRTRSLPRPVFNIVRYIENHKVSSVMNENVKMIFTPQEAVNQATEDPNEALQAQAVTEAASTFSRFSGTVWENIKQDQLNEEALEVASNVGTGIWHYYWDTSKKGGMIFPWIGEMAGETLDPINVFFGNPQQMDVQKQPYIIITSRDMVESVRSEAQANGLSPAMAEMITGDTDVQDEGYDGAKRELDDNSKVTVKTMYWRDEGQIMFCKVASSQMVKPPTPTQMTRYPIAVMQWERRRKSIHGIGDTEGIIPNQKTINFLLAMSALSAQLTGWPKMKINPNFVNPNSINNDPSQPLIDNSPPGQSGAEYMNPGQMSGHVKELIDTFIDYTKQLSSAQDAATGDMASGNLNASAIMLLQKAAGVPIESIKKRFYRVIEDIGRIWEEFWKVKYNTTRRVSVKDEEDNPMMTDFRGSDYAGIEFNLKIDIGPSSSYSEELSMASLDKLFDKQAIDTIQYLKYAPTNVVPFKDSLIKDLEQQQQMMAQQQAMMAEQEQAMMANQPDPQAEADAAHQRQMQLQEQKHMQDVQKLQMQNQGQKELAAMKTAGGAK